LSRDLELSYVNTSKHNTESTTPLCYASTTAILESVFVCHRSLGDIGHVRWAETTLLENVHDIRSIFSTMTKERWGKGACKRYRKSHPQPNAFLQRQHHAAASHPPSLAFKHRIPTRSLSLISRRWRRQRDRQFLHLLLSFPLTLRLTHRRGIQQTITSVSSPTFLPHIAAR
jgi:hypothetical protein